MQWEILLLLALGLPFALCNWAISGFGRLAKRRAGKQSVSSEAVRDPSL